MPWDHDWQPVENYKCVGQTLFLCRRTSSSPTMTESSCSKCPRSGGSQVLAAFLGRRGQQGLEVIMLLGISIPGTADRATLDPTRGIFNWPPGLWVEAGRTEHRSCPLPVLVICIFSVYALLTTAWGRMAWLTEVGPDMTSKSARGGRRQASLAPPDTGWIDEIAKKAAVP